MTKVLGIDYGERKIGLALAPDGKLALPLKVLKNNQAFGDLLKLIVQEEVAKIVVGLPIGLDGQITSQTNEVQDFIKRLAKEVKAEIVTEDERLTTVQAQRQGKDDAVAAMYLLQSYLDRQNG